MDREATQSLAIASMLAAFLVVPSLADTLPQSTFAMPSQSLAAAENSLTAAGLEPAQTGNIHYVTGGIGDEERDALEAAKNSYNLHVTSTDQLGEFNGETKVAIVDRQGNQLLTAQAGPLFYADLPPGNYTIEADHSGQMQSHKISVNQSKPSSLYFRW